MVWGNVNGYGQFALFLVVSLASELKNHVVFFGAFFAKAISKGFVIKCLKWDETVSHEQVAPVIDLHGVGEFNQIVVIFAPALIGWMVPTKWHVIGKNAVLGGIG